MKKRLICILLMFCMLFNSQVIGASTPTSNKAVKKEIKKVEAKIKSLEKKYENEKKGLTSVAGSVVSNHPLIIKSTNFFGGSSSYYWITNDINEPIYYLKLSGSYKNYGNVTCAVAKAVKFNYKTFRALKKEKSKLEKLQTALEEEIFLYDTNLNVGSTKKIKKKWMEGGGAYNTLKWKSSNTDIATVSKTGVVTAKRAGKVTITAVASASKIKSTSTVTVISPATAINLSSTAIEMNLNSTYTLGASLAPIGASEPIKYSSNDENIVSVSATGLLTALQTGTATITVKTLSGIKATCKVTVKNPITQMSFEQSEYTYNSFDLRWQDCNRLFLIVLPKEFTGEIYYTSSNNAVASIFIPNDDDTDLSATETTIELKGVGSCIITATTSSGLSANCTVTVIGDPED